MKYDEFYDQWNQRVLIYAFIVALLGDGAWAVFPVLYLAGGVVARERAKMLKYDNNNIFRSHSVP